MTVREDRPTIGERYAAATDSGNLKLGERRGDVDIIIAAGLVPDGLAKALYRLMTEFDTQRGPLDAAKQWVSVEMSKALTLRKAACAERERKDAAPDEARALAMMKRADELSQAAIASLRTEFMLVLASMSTLRQVRDLLGEFTRNAARARRVQIPEKALMYIAGRCLDAFMDPNCHHCDGRMFNGGGRHEHSGPQVICRPCKGSGHRRDEIGRDDVERLFAGHLMMEMDAAMYDVQRAIGRNSRAVDEAKVLIDAAAKA